MTREEAIGNLRYAIHWKDRPTDEALDMAIKALEQHPEDAISREDALKLIRDCGRCDDKTAYGTIYYGIENLPPIQPKTKTGHWITKVKSDLRGDMWPSNPKCSECGGEPYYSNTIYNYKFCPYCGAKMEE